MIKIKYSKGILYLISLILLLQVANAANMTVQQLINSYDYSYYDGTVNVTSQTNRMIDNNNNGLNDTLVVNMVTDATGAVNYKFIIEIKDTSGILINSTSQVVSSSNNSANVSFPSSLLSQPKFNYSIIINDNNDNMVFRKFDVESQPYTNYETGTNVTRITDQSINNNLLRLNVTINSSAALTNNITITLAYNTSKISKTQETFLSSGLQNISMDFDNETIKSTHYVGNFTIDSIVIGNKVFNPNQNTSIYNYEDFAKTSYIKSVIDERVDTNNNNLSDYLGINFTVNVLAADTYNISYDLYDQFNNYVISYNTTRTLSLGNQTVQTLINGSDIYKTKINGPYVLSFAKLAIGNNTKDILYNAYTTNQTFYSDYERPPLPDLKVEMAIIFSTTTNTTNITINISNIGQAPAFNIFLDIFDNTTYANNRSLSFMSTNETITYQFNITNTSNTTLYTSIVDFENLVDESNESNNIVQNTKPQVISLKIDSLTAMYSNSTMKIFEFVILNDGETRVTDVQWWFDTNDSNVINSTMNLSSLSANEKAFVYLNYNYSGTGSYIVRANATGLSSSATLSSLLSAVVSAGDFAITSFTNLNLEITKAVFGIQAKNNLENNLTNLNWSIAAGDGTVINATSLFNPLSPNETVFIFVNYDYGIQGAFNPIASVTNGTYSDSKTITLNVKHLEAYNLSLLNQSVNGSIFEFIIKNNLNSNLTNVNWTFDTKNSNIINGTTIMILQPNEQSFVYIDYNFTAAGTFNVNANTKNTTLADSKNLTVVI